MSVCVCVCVCVWYKYCLLRDNSKLQYLGFCLLKCMLFLKTFFCFCLFVVVISCLYSAVCFTTSC